MEIDLANCTQRTIYSISLSFYSLFVRFYSFPSIKPTATGLNVHFCFQLVQLLFYLRSLKKFKGYHLLIARLLPWETFEAIAQNILLFTNVGLACLCQKGNPSD